MPTFSYLKTVLKERRERKGAILAEINEFIELAIGLKSVQNYNQERPRQSLKLKMPDEVHRMPIAS